jgi:hypothetical protein
VLRPTAKTQQRPCGLERLDRTRKRRSGRDLEPFASFTFRRTVNRRAVRLDGRTWSSVEMSPLSVNASEPPSPDHGTGTGAVMLPLRHPWADGRRTWCSNRRPSWSGSRWWCRGAGSNPLLYEGTGGRGGRRAGRAVAAADAPGRQAVARALRPRESSIKSDFSEADAIVSARERRRIA